MKKRILILALAVIMIVGTVPFAAGANGDETRCPACGDSLYFRTYTVTRDEGKKCCEEITYEQPYCLRHGDMYNAREVSRREHAWKTDYFSGDARCERCWKVFKVDKDNLICPTPLEDHRWATVPQNGSIKCMGCGAYSNMRNSVGVECPEYSDFHYWMPDVITGEPVCVGCGVAAE